jgi:hypothetical protein
MDNWSTFTGRTLGLSDESCAVVSRPVLVLLSGAIATKFCTGTHFYRLLILYHGIRQHETILFILDIKDLGHS